MAAPLYRSGSPPSDSVKLRPVLDAMKESLVLCALQSRRSRYEKPAWSTSASRFVVFITTNRCGSA